MSLRLNKLKHFPCYVWILRLIDCYCLYIHSLTKKKHLPQHTHIPSFTLCVSLPLNCEGPRIRHSWGRFLPLFLPPPQRSWSNCSPLVAAICLHLSIKAFAASLCLPPPTPQNTSHSQHSLHHSDAPCAPPPCRTTSYCSGGGGGVTFLSCTLGKQ